MNNISVVDKSNINAIKLLENTGDCCIFIVLLRILFGVLLLFKQKGV